MSTIQNKCILMLQRVQCGEHYTVASTTDSELYYWGLRFKNSLATTVDNHDDYGSHASIGSNANKDDLKIDSLNVGSQDNKDDLRLESITPRQASQGHSRQNSLNIGSQDNTDDMRLESVTPRQVSQGHSRQNSINNETQDNNESITPRQAAQGHSRQNNRGQGHSRQASTSSITSVNSIKESLVENQLGRNLLSLYCLPDWSNPKLEIDRRGFPVKST